MRDIIRQITVILGTLAVIVVNALASILPLNNQTTGEISDQFEVYFVPAGYVFAIWGLIYLALIAYSIYQALPAQRDNPRLRRVGYLYVLSCAANIAWLYLWHWERFPLTLIAMVALLLLLIGIYLMLGIGWTPVSRAETWLVRVPFSIYLGWITVATVANATTLLESIGWDRWGISAVAWAVIMLVVAAIVASLVSITRGDLAYVAVIVWAFAGIAVKHSDTRAVAITAWVTAGIVVLTLLIGAPLASARMKEQMLPSEMDGIRDRW
jgi:benzodiazapine receptor